MFAVAEQFHGTVRVQSSPGKGATFTASFPLISSGSGSNHGDSDGQIEGSGIVLLVDDEENIRSVTERMLKRFGYEVYSCSFPEKVLEIVERLDRSPIVLVTDVVMPKMSGIDLAKKVHQKYPDLPVLYVSGYLDQQMPASYYEVISQDNFMQKPYGAKELHDKIVALLQGGTSHE